MTEFVVYSPDDTEQEVLRNEFWNECKKTIKNHFKKTELPPVARNYIKILEGRFFAGDTLEDVGKKIGKTRERTRYMESKAIHILREELPREFLDKRFLDVLSSPIREVVEIHVKNTEKD